MSWKTTYIEDKDAELLCAVLKSLGYGVSIADCTEYGMNIVKNVAGSNPDHAAEVAAEIQAILLGPASMGSRGGSAKSAAKADAARANGAKGGRPSVVKHAGKPLRISENWATNFYKETGKKLDLVKKDWIGERWTFQVISDESTNDLVLDRHKRVDPHCWCFR